MVSYADKSREHLARAVEETWAQFHDEIKDVATFLDDLLLKAFCESCRKESANVEDAIGAKVTLAMGCVMEAALILATCVWDRLETYKPPTQAYSERFESVLKKTSTELLVDVTDMVFEASLEEQK